MTSEARIRSSAARTSAGVSRPFAPGTTVIEFSPRSSTATTASPLPQLFGSGALFVDPTDLPGWERALLSVLRCDELRHRLREEGLAAARRLTWDSAAKQLQAILQKVAA